MHRRQLMRNLMLGPAALWAGASPGQGQRRRPPNYIVILLDDLGCTDLGCFGAKDLKTPNIDALARSGARFTNWYSNASVCAPARSSLMTGRYPMHAGVPTNGPVLGSNQRTLPSLLKQNGYKTGLFGKWHLGVPENAAPNERGFDEFYGFHSGCVDFYSHRFYWGEPRRPNYHDLWRNRDEIFQDGQYLTELLTGQTQSFIRNHSTEPFFLYLAYNAPHYPMHAPKKYMDRFLDLPFERRVYAAMISAVDDGVGAILEEVRRQGLSEDTCIFLLGDNGATTEPRAGLGGQPAVAGNNGIYRGFKFSLFDGGIHVPGIMSWPGTIPQNQTISEVVMTMDILPTICNASGVKLPAGYRIDGSDIMPVVSRQAKSPHDAIYWAQGPQLAVRRGKWKLVMNGFTADRTAEGRKPLTGEDSMFLSDLSQDPGESKNLRRMYPELVDELSTLAHKWKQEMTALAEKGGG